MKVGGFSQQLLYLLRSCKTAFLRHKEKELFPKIKSRSLDPALPSGVCVCVCVPLCVFLCGFLIPVRDRKMSHKLLSILASGESHLRCFCAE